MKIEVRNSFCTVSQDACTNALDLIQRVLTYQNDIEAEKGQLFYQLNRAKQYNNEKMYHAVLAKIKHLEANEWVCWFKDNKFPTGHINIVKASLNRAGFKYELNDLRDDPGKDYILKWNNKPFDPRYYQKEMIDLGKTHKRGVFEAAVGSGKSLVMAYLIKEFSVNSLVIVPSRGLLDQIYNDFKVWFGKQNVQVVDTAKIRKNVALKKIRIVTIQSLASLQKSGDLHKLINDINGLYVDEIHHAGASSYTNLLSEMDHIYYRFGFSGTFLRNDGKSLDMWGFLSNVLYRYPAHKAIQEGYLTPLSVLVYEIQGKFHSKYQKEYDNNYCANPELLDVVARAISSVKGQQALILVNRKDKSGKIFHEYLKKLGIENRYISGDNSKEEITQTISDFNDKVFDVLIGSSVIGEGIDVRSTDHLFMCQGGKSEIVMVQAIGRAIRLYKGKDHAFVHDFRFTDTKYMEKHFEQRKDIYNRNFECDILNVNS